MCEKETERDWNVSRGSELFASCRTVICVQRCVTFAADFNVCEMSNCSRDLNVVTFAADIIAISYRPLPT